MAWPVGMPQPPEGMRWKMGRKISGDPYRVVKLKRGFDTVAWGVVQPPKGVRVEDIDAEVVSVARYVLSKLDAIDIKGAQHERLSRYGKWS